jgi:SAM-dependent methyltransferase
MAQDDSEDRPRWFFSRCYASISERLDQEGLAELRAELLGPLSGAVVEIGAGNGRNFTRYPSAVTSVTAIEPEPHLRALAVRATAGAAVPVRVRAGVAERLPLPDRSLDGAVLCLVMCSLPDRPAALAEVRRVLRPGGVLRFLEHTIADTPGLRAVQKLADATLWPWLAGGCHTATDPVGDLRQAGFGIEELRRFRFPAARFPQPCSPHVIGTARASDGT